MLASKPFLWHTAKKVRCYRTRMFKHQKLKFYIKFFDIAVGGCYNAGNQKGKL